MLSNKSQVIHFVGIGGVGVSALARYYLGKGCKVSGSDLAFSEITEALKKSGAKIAIGQHKAGNVPQNADLIIYSPAIKQGNPELEEAGKRKIGIQSYPEALGDLTKSHFTVAVSGTHGKSTTTSMLGILLAKAGLDPTVIVGTKVKEFGNSNCRVGKSKFLIIEADEHFASFLNYWPKIIVLTNIEADHLDYYKTLGNIIKAFKEYVGHLPKAGWLVANKNDKNTAKLISESQIKEYSLKQQDAKKLRKLLKVPGDHNVANALAALTTARILGVGDKTSFKSLSEYRGAWRRFDQKTIRAAGKKILLISDYGHHPTEIKATLKAAREKYPKKRIWCVFQPHQYQRTYYLFKDFVKVFRESPVDRIIITDIYDVAGREEKRIKEKVSSEKLAKSTSKKSVYFLQKDKILDYLQKNMKDGQVLIIMGAGDIYDLALSLLNKNKVETKI